MKIIDAIQMGTPETLPIYHDSVQVTENGNILFEGVWSTEPDPTRPYPHTDIKWPTFAVRIAIGSYCGIVMDGTKYKPGWTKYIYLYNQAGGIEIPTQNPDANNGNLYIAKGVLCHTGYSAEWPGSIACQTIPPAGAEMFWDCFEIGEKVTYNLRKAA